MFGLQHFQTVHLKAKGDGNDYANSCNSSRTSVRRSSGEMSVSLIASCTRTTLIIARTAVENRAQCPDNRKTRRVHFESLVADEIKARVYGDTAVVTGRSTAKGKDQDGKMDDQRHWTRVLVRRDGRWQFVNFHAASIRKP